MSYVLALSTIYTVMSGRGPLTVALPYVKEHIELIDTCKKTAIK
jgi:hypothetical protein